MRKVMAVRRQGSSPARVIRFRQRRGAFDIEEHQKFATLRLQIVRAEGVRVESRGKDTRANMVERFKDGLYVYPAALFRLTKEEAGDAERPRGASSSAPTGDPGLGRGTSAEGAGCSGPGPTSAGASLAIARERGELRPQVRSSTSDSAARALPS